MFFRKKIEKKYVWVDDRIPFINYKKFLWNCPLNFLIINISYYKFDIIVWLLFYTFVLIDIFYFICYYMIIHLIYKIYVNFINNKKLHQVL